MSSNKYINIINIKSSWKLIYALTQVYHIAAVIICMIFNYR